MTDYRDILESVGYPTDVLVLDFECFFDKSYSIKKLGMLEYVFDPRFAVTGLGVQVLEKAFPYFVRPQNLMEVTPGLIDEYGPNLEHCTVVGHNLPFDALVLREKYGITPKYTVDTIDLARHLDARGKHSLEHLAKKYGSPTPKGDTQQFSGLRWEDMTPEQQANLSEYCRNDIDITAHLLKVLLPRITRPDQELRLATQTLRMFLVPQIQMDLDLGTQLISGMEQEVQRSVDMVNAQGLLVEEPPKITTRTCRPPTVRKVRAEDISGDKMFAKLLQEALPDGENIPMKQGKNKMIPALAKSDDQCNYLLSHPSPVVRALMDARKAAGSWPGHMSRVRRLISQAECRDGLWGVPLRYYGAHTGRYSGTGGVNPQNFGARDVHDLIKQVGQMLMAPDDYIFGTGDLSQIEARVIAWFAGQDDLVQAFADGTDIYSEFAEQQIFHKETRKPREDDTPEYADELKIRRSFGKMACLALGFGMGAGTFYDRCRADVDLRPLFVSGEHDLPFCQRIVQLYRNRYPKIVSFWYELDKAWKFVTRYKDQRTRVSHNGHTLEFFNEGGTTTIVLPSGRHLFYPQARVSSDGYNAEYGSKPSYHIYGGKLAENVTQAAARDVFVHGLLLLEDAGFNSLFSVHDQTINLLVDDDTAPAKLAEMHHIQTIAPDWADGLPIATEGVLTKRYHKGE